MAGRHRTKWLNDYTVYDEPADRRADDETFRQGWANAQVNYKTKAYTFSWYKITFGVGASTYVLQHNPFDSQVRKNITVESEWIGEKKTKL